MEHKKFTYKSLEDLKQEALKVHADIPFSNNTAILNEPYTISGKTLHNRIVIQPLEGCDSTENGSPGELTRRRYQRFAAGGAGLIWFEATAITPEARAQKHQLTLNTKNMDSYKRLVDEIKETGLKKNGFEPVIIHQLTHSGRFSKPNGYAEPIIAQNNPIFEKDGPINEDRIITDDRLSELEELYADAASLSAEAGFDGIDVKACHGYLTCELLSAFTRKGIYGGSYENRTRFLKNCIRSVRSVLPTDRILTTRLSLYDGFPYPYGFGVKKDGGLDFDITEPLQLIHELKDEFGIRLFNISIGNPYVNPHVSRPYDIGGYTPDEHPLEGISRFINITRQVQEADHEIAIIGAGISYLRQYAPLAAAAMLEQGICSLIGFGRGIFADPELPNEITSTGTIDIHKVCMSCSQCTDHLRRGMETGCFIRDREYQAALKR